MPVTFTFSTPGTYTIDDDGIRGNGVSVIRNAAGAVIFTITHPADFVGLTVSTPGVNLIFNVLDSFGPANVAVGVFTDAAQSPDSIVVNQLRSDGFITLVSNGSITESGSDPAADLIAAGLQISAGTGIGTAANALETQVTFIEAETNTGGINIANFGNVQIGGLTAAIDGLDVVTSGDLNFSTTGFIVLNDTTGPEMVHGGESSGNVTLTALGADSDIFATVDRVMVRAAGGGITLNAGRDFGAGTGGSSFNNDVLAATFVNIHAGRDVVLDGSSNIRSGAFGGFIGGPIDIQAGRNIRMASTNGGSESIDASFGNATLTTGPGGAFIQDAIFSNAVASTGDIIVNADVMQINNGGLNTTGVGSITLRPVTPGRAIDLGSAVDLIGALSLSEAEVDRLFTLAINIGDANSGPVEFSAPISPTTFPTSLTVRSATEILVRSTILLDSSLTLIAGNDIFFTASGVFTTSNGGFAGFVDQVQGDGGAGGSGILGATMNVTTTIALTGSVDGDTLTGNGSANTLAGLGGNDTLRGMGGADMIDGGTGADSMFGGLGDDTFFVDSAGDVVSEAVGEGFDNVQSSVSYTLAAGVEVEILSTTDNGGTADINLSGNAFGQTIVGNAGRNLLDGGGGGDNLRGLGGDDTYLVSAGDIVTEAVGSGLDNVAARTTFTLNAGAEVEVLSTSNHGGTAAINLFGNEFGQTVIGNAGSNYLDGVSGADRLQGLGGDDTLIVDSDDIVIEAVGGGMDNVAARASYVLTAGAEVEVLSTTNHAGTGAINLFGNAFGQTIIGNAGSNYLDGGGGIDRLQGLGGDDTLIVDSDDIVIEAVSGGMDNVAARTSYVLTAGAEIEVLSTTDHAGTGAINLFGNAFGQTIIGNAGSNYLDGGGGVDRLQGLGGNDTLIVDADDIVIEAVGGGMDNVASRNSFTLNAGAEVEVLSTTDHGGTLGINLTGNEFGQTVIGNAGNNILNGVGGSDRLQGLGGADTFSFSSALGPTNVDTIIDMVSGVDKIALDDSIFTGLALGALPASAFVIGTQAQDADDRIIYNPATGALLFDSDGAGGAAAVQFAILQGAPAVAAADFFVT